MKNAQRIFFLFLLIAFAACATINKSVTLAGKWRLTETLADPGDGSGKWNPVTKESFLTFNNDGTVTSTESPNYQSYTIADSTKLEFTLTDGRKQIVSYRMEGRALIIMPQCIEACGSKYMRVN